MKNTILIIDDEPVLLSALIDKFSMEGFVVTTAANGEEGLAMAINNHPDLILLDIIMPVMDGITMLEKLRQDAWGKNAKVILLTNLTDPGEMSKDLLKTVSGYLVKSDWKIDDVVKQVREKLKE